MIRHCVVKPVRVLKVRRLHAELGCALVHGSDERLLTARNGFGKHDGGIVCGGYHNRLYKVVHLHLLALLEVYLRTAHLRRACRGRKHGVVIHNAAVYGFHNEQQRHDLCDRRGRQCLVRIHFVKDRSGVGFHEYCRHIVKPQIGIFSIERCCRRRERSREYHCRKHKCRQYRCRITPVEYFHKKRPFLSFHL